MKPDFFYLQKEGVHITPQARAAGASSPAPRRKAAPPLHFVGEAGALTLVRPTTGGTRSGSSTLSRKARRGHHFVPGAGDEAPSEQGPSKRRNGARTSNLLEPRIRRERRPETPAQPANNRPSTAQGPTAGGGEKITPYSLSEPGLQVREGAAGARRPEKTLTAPALKCHARMTARPEPKAGGPRPAKKRGQGASRRQNPGRVP